MVAEREAINKLNSGASNLGQVGDFWWEGFQLPAVQ